MKKFDNQELLLSLKERKFQRVREIFNTYPTIDISDSFNEMDDILDDTNINLLLYIFKVVKPEISASFFSELNQEIQEKLISSLNDDEIKTLVSLSSNDDLTDFISYFPANVVTKIFKNTSQKDRATINQLLGYKEDSAGSIMTSEYLTLLDDETCSQAIDKIRLEGKKAETIYTLFIRNKTFDLVGVLNLDDLIFASPTTLLKDVMSKSYQVCHVNDDQEEVAKLFKRYDLYSIGVLNEDEKLTGIITIDDIMDVVEEEQNEDIEALAKVAPLDESYTKTSIPKLALKCIPWLVVLIVCGVGSMALQNEFQGIISQLAVISVFLTMVCSTSGNSGSQASALMIRGLSTNDFTSKDFLKILWKEFRVSLLTGICVALFSFLWILFLFSIQVLDIVPSSDTMYQVNDNVNTWMILSSVVSLTLFLNIVLSKLLAVGLVFLLPKLKLDPAVIAGPLITTLMDLISLAVYFVTIYLVLVNGILAIF